MYRINFSKGENISLVRLAGDGTRVIKRIILYQILSKVITSVTQFKICMQNFRIKLIEINLPFRNSKILSEKLYGFHHLQNYLTNSERFLNNFFKLESFLVGKKEKSLSGKKFELPKKSNFFPLELFSSKIF